MAETGWLQAILYGLGEYLLIGSGMFGAFLCSLLLIRRGASGESARWAVLALMGFLSIALVSGWNFVRNHGPGGDGVLAQLLTAEGTECRVVQSWNDWSEPYTVSFYFKQRGGAWGWCYVDHEDHRWRRCELKLDEQSHAVQVSEKGRLRAELDLHENTFSLFDPSGERLRTLPAPQELRAPPY